MRSGRWAGVNIPITAAQSGQIDLGELLGLNRLRRRPDGPSEGDRFARFHDVQDQNQVLSWKLQRVRANEKVTLTGRKEVKMQVLPAAIRLERVCAWPATAVVWHLNQARDAKGGSWEGWQRDRRRTGSWHTIQMNGNESTVQREKVVYQKTIGRTLSFSRRGNTTSQPQPPTAVPRLSSLQADNQVGKQQ